MQFYGVGNNDLFRIQEVASLPTWTTAYTRRLVYNRSDEKVYYGTSTGWSLVIEHSHANKTILDKLGEDDGSLYFDGSAVGGLLAIADEHIFDSTSARDDYFIAHPTELVADLYVVVLPNYLYVYKDDAFVNVTPIIRGPRGFLGFGTFTIRAVGPLAEKYLYDAEDEGFSYLAVDTQKLYIRWGVAGTWGGPYDFPNLNSSGLDDWERFPGYTLETKFDYPYPGYTTEILKLTINEAVFATRETRVTDNGFISVIECPTLSIYRQSTMVEGENSITETIENLEQEQ